MITLPYSSPLAARQSRINAGWRPIKGGSYIHGGAIARIDGCNVVITKSTEALHAEVAAAIEEYAALREEGEFDRSRQGGK